MNDKIKGDAVFMVCFPWEEGAVKLEGTNTHVKQSKDIPELINSLANAKSPSTDVSVLKEALEKIKRIIKNYRDWGGPANNLGNHLENECNEMLLKYSTPTAPADKEEASIIDRCETAVGVLRTMLNKLKMPLGVEAADNILLQIKGYRLMNQPEPNEPQSMPIPTKEPLSQADEIEGSISEGEDELALQMWDNICNEFVNVDSLEHALEWVEDSYTDDGEMHPEFTSFEVFKKVGSVDAIIDGDVCKGFEIRQSLQSE